MKYSNRLLLLLAVTMAGAFLSGCPLLMVGSLGYTGYQYHEKEGVFAPGQPLGAPAPEDKNAKSSSSTSKSASSTSQPPPPSSSNVE